MSDSWWADAINFYLVSDMRPFIIPHMYDELEIAEQLWGIKEGYGMRPEID